MQAYRAARQHTEDIALIEGNQYGTTCARVGCMPSKLLIAPAELCHRTQLASQFGIDIPTVAVNGKQVMNRVKSERDRFVGFIKEDAASFVLKHRLFSQARFIDDTRLELADGRILEAERIVIATGSRPKIQDVFLPVKDKVFTTDELFYFDDLPASAAVFGAGAIGLEMAQALHRLGVRVHLFGKANKVKPLSHPELTACARSIFEKELPFVASPEALSLSKTATDKVQISFSDANTPDAGLQQVTVDSVLVATGRMPNTDNLGLENTTLTRQANGVPVYNPKTLQCTSEKGGAPIFIAGDATDELTVLHEAYHEGFLAGQNAACFPQIQEQTIKAPMAIVFTEPQIAVVGQSYQQLVDAGIDFETGTESFEDQGRSRVFLMNQGMLAVFAERRSGRLLGAEIAAPAGEHMAHLLAWCIQLQLTVDTVLSMPFYHPVIEEGLESALQTLKKSLREAPCPV